MSNPSYPGGGQPDPNQPQPDPNLSGPGQPGPGQPDPSQQSYPTQPYQPQQMGAPQFAGQPGLGGKTIGDPGTLDLPWYGIGPVPAVVRAFKKYVRFDGRASRGEFWWFFLFAAIAGNVLTIPYYIELIHLSTVTEAGGTPNPAGLFLSALPAIIFSLAILLPNLGLMWRRLHDTGRSGAWFFFVFACGVGVLVPLIMCIMDSDPAGQRFDQVQGGGPGYGPGVPAGPMG